MHTGIHHQLTQCVVGIVDNGLLTEQTHCDGSLRDNSITDKGFQCRQQLEKRALKTFLVQHLSANSLACKTYKLNVSPRQIIARILAKQNDGCVCRATMNAVIQTDRSQLLLDVPFVISQHFWGYYRR